MEKQVIQSICEKVYKAYPMVQGVIPEVRPQPNGTQLLVFESKGKVSAQKAIPIQVRVIVDENGKIVKLSSSR
jgi:hypothetical protein